MCFSSRNKLRETPQQFFAARFSEVEAQMSVNELTKCEENDVNYYSDLIHIEHKTVVINQIRSPVVSVIGQFSGLASLTGLEE